MHLTFIAGLASLEGLAVAREYAPVGAVCRPKNNDGYITVVAEGGPSECRGLCDADDVCGAYEFENHSADYKECELHEATVVDPVTTAAQGPCELDDENDYRCCFVLASLLAEPTPAPSLQPPAPEVPTPAPTTDGGSKKKKKSESQTASIVAAVLVTLFVVAGVLALFWCTHGKPLQGKQPPPGAPEPETTGSASTTAAAP
mmetsp:Transcript_15113/g.45123  ORF Transcript_15113/g.45123 Transcript_15113/m.45123 type:complete len:202 (-) Transcript_15113:18-623(-)